MELYDSRKTYLLYTMLDAIKKTERDRYVNIYFQLTSGAKEAWDC